MSEAETPIPASDLAIRATMGVVMVVIACVAIWTGGWLFRALVTVAASVMLIEWADMHRVDRKLAYVGVLLMAALLVLAPIVPAPGLYVADHLASSPFGQTFAIALGLAVLLGLVCRRTTMAGGFLYIAVPGLALLILHHASFGIVLWVMSVVWSTDIFAYFAGRSIGGPKLAPRVSPNKTWAGLIGGMAGAGVIGGFTAGLLELPHLFVWIGAPMGLLAQAGDLYESWLKRRAGVKDSGTLLPGHGGALDRLDGLLPVAVVTMILLLAGTART